jgi:hypothetical protein
LGNLTFALLLESAIDFPHLQEHNQQVYTLNGMASGANLSVDEQWQGICSIVLMKKNNHYG